MNLRMTMSGSSHSIMRRAGSATRDEPVWRLSPQSLTQRERRVLQPRFVGLEDGRSRTLEAG